jgi:hypothetical protein
MSHIRDACHKEIFRTCVPLERLETFLEVLETSRTVRLLDVIVKRGRLVTTINLLKSHDRMIVSMHMVSNSKAMLTDDQEIRGLAKVKTIWN